MNLLKRIPKPALVLVGALLVMPVVISVLSGISYDGRGCVEDLDAGTVCIFAGATPTDLWQFLSRTIDDLVYAAFSWLAVGYVVLIVAALGYRLLKRDPALPRRVGKWLVYPFVVVLAVLFYMPGVQVNVAKDIYGGMPIDVCFLAIGDVNVGDWYMSNEVVCENERARRLMQ